MFDEIKEKFIKFITSRSVMLAGVIIAFACVLLARLFYLQIIMGDYYKETAINETIKDKYIPAPRGCIYDRNKNLLAHDERADSVTIEDVYPDMKLKEKNRKINETLQKTIEIIEANNDEIDFDFDIVRDVSGKYIFKPENESDILKFLRDAYGRTSVKELKPEEKVKTAKQVVEDLCYSFSIGDYTDPQNKSRETFEAMKGYSPEIGFKILVIRYRMAKQGFQNYLATTIASKVSEETAAAILESKDQLEGVDITSSYVRMYDDDFFCFSPILGYTGKISVSELDEFNKAAGDETEDNKKGLFAKNGSDDDEEQKYDLNDIVGKSGIEKSLESELQGTKGKDTIHVDKTGHILEVSDSVAPVAGHDVYLTIDKELTKGCYKILEKNLATILLDKLKDSKRGPVFDEKPSANQMWLPIYDAYINLFVNDIIDISKFKNADAQENEKALYAAFVPKKKETIAAIKDELLNKKTPKNQLPEEYQEYMDHILDILRDKNYPIISADKDDEDFVKINKEWKAGTISLAQYIDRAIINEWVDASKLDIENLYADSDETYAEIVNYIVAGKEGKGATKQYGLNNDHVFDTYLYKHMLYSDTITPRQVCNVLLEQGIIKAENIDPDELTVWKNGGVSPYVFLRNRLEKLDITPAQLGLYPCTGSMVITDVQTGDILALVSYPGYDNNRLSDGDPDYLTSLLMDKSNAKPMYNHATLEMTAPGSTFKMVTATAGLMENVITTTSAISCSGIFSKSDPQHPAKCWKAGGHGSLNVVGGIRNSCNCFFYEVGYRLGTSGNKYDSNLGCAKLAKYAGEYGLTDKSGVEIVEAEPIVASEDAVRGAIGQDTNNYSTVGLARYITTVANRGKCFDLTLVDKIALDSYGKMKDNSAKVRNQINMPQAYWDFIHHGMREVVMDKPYYSELSNKGCPVAGKTGTAEEGWKPNHSLFVCYAPYSDKNEQPKIAVATRVANGYTSSYAAQITEKVLEYYFEYKTLDEILGGGEALIGGGRED